jgi:hypothetical protein
MLPSASPTYCVVSRSVVPSARSGANADLLREMTFADTLTSAEADKPGPPPVDAGAVRRHHVAVLTVDRGDNAGFALPASGAAGHPQRFIGGLFGFGQRLGAFELPHG